MRRRIDSACLSARADSALLDEAGGARQGTGVMSRVMLSSVYATAFIILLFSSIFLMVSGVYLLQTYGILEVPQSDVEHRVIREFSLRLFIAILISSSYLVLFIKKSSRAWILEERWRLILVLLFTLGSALALLDPRNAIQQEDNWIRYPTAAALGFAGALALLSVLSNAHSVVDRLLGLGFGFLLVVAGTDELFEFHENTARYFATLLPSDLPVHAQDVTTLAVALAGVLVLGTLVLFRRFTPWAGSLFAERKYRRALRLFAFAVLTFALAMALDSFDTHLAAYFERLRQAMAYGVAPGLDDPFWMAVTDIRAYLNSLEELLELLSALGLLMMVGTVYSIQLLGCGQSHIHVRRQMN